MSDTIIRNFFPDIFDFALLGIAALILAVPRRYFLHLIGWLAMPVVLISLELGHPPHYQHKNIGYSLALAWLFSGALLISTAIAVKLVGIGLWAKWRRRPVFSLEGWEPGSVFAGLQRALFLCWGVLAAFLFALLLRKLLHGVSPSWLAYLIALAVIALMWAIPRPALSPSGPTLSRLRREAWRLFFATGRWSLAGMLVAVAATPVFVGAGAAEVAGDARHCIQVADRHGGHRPVRSMLDLSFLTMKAAYMHGEQQHALLIVESGPERRLYNWSYRQLGFVNQAAYRDNPRYWPALTCQPRQDFAERLPYVLPQAEDTSTVRILGRTFRFPAKFRPRARGGWFPRVTLYIAPAFRSSLDGPDDPRGWFGTPVQLYPDRWQNSHREFVNPATGPTDGAESTYGLAHTTGTVERGSHSADFELFAERDGTGALTSSIYCNELRFAGPFSCEHRFVHDGMLFRFRQRPEDVVDWARIQEWLVAAIGEDGADASER